MKVAILARYDKQIDNWFGATVLLTQSPTFLASATARKMHVVKVGILPLVAACAASAEAYPRLPKGFEIRYKVKMTLEGLSDATRSGSYVERYQQIGDKVFLSRDRYEGNLKSVDYTYEAGGTRKILIVSDTPPRPGQIQRFTRAPWGESVAHLLLEPSYILNGKNASDFFSAKALSQPNFSTESAGDRYSGEIDQVTGLINRIEIKHATGEHSRWTAKSILNRDGFTLPEQVTYDADFGHGAKTHTEFELLDFKKIDRLDKEVTAENLPPGSLLKDEIRGYQYEILASGKLRETRKLASPKRDLPPTKDKQKVALAFVGLAAIGGAILGLNMSSKSKRKETPAQQGGEDPAR